MRREAANENVSMQSSFGNVSILSGYPPTTEEQRNGAQRSTRAGRACALTPSMPQTGVGPLARNPPAPSHLRVSLSLVFSRSPFKAPSSRPLACLCLCLREECTRSISSGVSAPSSDPVASCLYRAGHPVAHRRLHLSGPRSFSFPK